MTEKAKFELWHDRDADDVNRLPHLHGEYHLADDAPRYKLALWLLAESANLLVDVLPRRAADSGPRD